MALTTYSTLASVADAIAADAGENSEDDPQTDFTFIGQTEAATRRGPPSVVWVPGGGEITDPDQDESELSKIGYQRNPVCQVRFLGAGYPEAERLMLDWLAGARRTQQGTVIPRGEVPTQETVTGASRYQITVEVLVMLPVPYETYTRKTIENTSQSGEITDP